MTEPAPLHIAVHGFGTYPVLFRHLLEIARQEAPHITWSMILPTTHHLDMMLEVLPRDRILCLEVDLPRHWDDPRDLDDIADYPGNFYLDIEAEKTLSKHRPAAVQVSRFLTIYRCCRRFLSALRPDMLLAPQVEGFDGKMLLALARQIGIEPVVPTLCRNLGGVFFSDDAYETLPRYRQTSVETRTRARDFIQSFRARHVAALNLGATEAAEPALSDFRRPLVQRLAGFLNRLVRRPDLLEWEMLRISLMNNLPVVAQAIWCTRRYRNSFYYDLPGLNDLPHKFIYYPLQYSPESSINTPAAYFVDQFRAIDAIRMAMPNDCTLVIKEHPVCLAMRDAAFMRALRRRAGVQVIRYDADARQLILRAALTMTVTGTSALEAFLLGRPALQLGPTFFVGFSGGVARIGELAERIRYAMATPPADVDVETAIAEVFDVQVDTVFRPPGVSGEPVLRTSNLRRLLQGIERHWQRVSA